MNSTASKGWHSRGYLPHFDLQEHPVALTFRLEGTLPRAVLEAWQEEQRGAPSDALLRKRIERYLDSGHGPTWLREPAIARVVEDAFMFFDGDRYRLHAWVVMPNHVHVLTTPIENHSVGEIVGSWKRHSAREAQRLLGRTGRFWQPDYWDRSIRDERHFEQVREYIENNPVKAGLCRSPEEWLFGSARRSVLVSTGSGPTSEGIDRTQQGDGAGSAALQAAGTPLRSKRRSQRA